MLFEVMRSGGVEIDRLEAEHQPVELDRVERPRLLEIADTGSRGASTLKRAVAGAGPRGDDRAGRSRRIDWLAVTGQAVRSERLDQTSRSVVSVTLSSALPWP